MSISERIRSIRKFFASYSIAGYIVPSTDEYQNEYTSSYARRLEYITGFTGSNGIVIILSEKVLFFTDGRYKEQSQKELPPECEIHDLSELKSIKIEDSIGYDPMLFTQSQLRLYDNLDLQPVDTNLVDKLWDDKPQVPRSTIYNYPVEYAGVSSENKIATYRATMQKYGASHSLVTSTDSICWILNIRASDIEFSPLLLSYLIVSQDDIRIFIEDREACASMSRNVTISSLCDIHSFLRNLSNAVMLDKNTCPIGLSSLIKHPIYKEDLCSLPKACKNSMEVKHSFEVHVSDAVALYECIAWIYESIKQQKNITEHDIGLKLTHERQKQVGYISDSFPAIVGYQEHGAIIHYRANSIHSKSIQGNGLLLIDSGGHYFGGTTDVTRTIVIGSPTAEQKKRYTQVLKGHIALSMQQFPQGTTGANLDALARMHLWQSNCDYAHGTGHGVGNALSVHEGPQRINQHNMVPLQKGMIVSNEPGYYKSGEYGIRIENLMVVEDASRGFLRFGTLTLVPYCSALIDVNILSKDELIYLQNYYKLIYTKLSERLSVRAKMMLDTELLSMNV
jgi:Xaa-Pro aminopeptidase